MITFSVTSIASGGFFCCHKATCIAGCACRTIAAAHVCPTGRILLSILGNTPILRKFYLIVAVQHNLMANSLDYLPKDCNFAKI